MNRIVVALLLVALCIPALAFAIDREAGHIDSLGVNAAAFDDSDEVGLIATTEIAVPVEEDNWSVVAGGSMAEVSPEANVDDLTTWSVFMGMKHYLTRELSAEATGHYRDMDLSDAKILGVDLTVKQRFKPVDEALSPYAQVGGTLQDIDWGDGVEGLTQVLLHGRLGCDILMRDDMAIVLEAGYSRALEVSGDGDTYGDGFIAAVLMKYYWQ